MVRPSKPSPDAYDRHPLVMPHFSALPEMVELWDEDRERCLDDEVCRRLRQLYRSHDMIFFDHCGLYYAGGQKHVLDPEFEYDRRVIVLVLVLCEKDLPRWYELENEARELLPTIMKDDKHKCMQDPTRSHNIPLRYYRQGNVQIQGTEDPPLPQSLSTRPETQSSQIPTETSTWASIYRQQQRRQQQRVQEQRRAAAGNSTYNQSYSGVASYGDGGDSSDLSSMESNTATTPLLFSLSRSQTLVPDGTLGVEHPALRRLHRPDYYEEARGLGRYNPDGEDEILSFSQYA